jgi:Coenzyme PQQ synthesis protein D (PqqD)
LTIRQESPRAEPDLGMVRPRRRTDVQTCLVDGELVVLDRDREFVHQLNKTASFIWEQCDGRRTAAEIADQLGETFEVDGQTALKDVLEILANLKDLNLVEDAE